MSGRNRVSGILWPNNEIGGGGVNKAIRMTSKAAMMYRAMKNAQKKLDVAQMRMLRWMCLVTHFDRIRNAKN